MRVLDVSRAEALERCAWRPIETAPKDREINFKFSDGAFGHGHWDADMYAKRPKPFWMYWHCLGINHMREHQPTHWQEICP